MRPEEARSQGKYDISIDKIWAVPDNVAFAHKDRFNLVNVEKGEVKFPEEWDIKAALENDKSHISLIIIHGTGSGYGDILSGVYAMDALKAHFKAHGKTLQIDALCRETAMDHYFDICRIRDSFDHVIPFAIKVHDLTRYDYMTSTETLLSEKPFQEMNFYDYWLHRFGLDPNKVDKTASIAPNPKVLKTVKQLCEVAKEALPKDKKVCLLNVFATKLRCIPPRVRNRLLEVLAQKYTIALFAADSDYRELQDWLKKMPEDLKKNVVDMSEISRQGWDYATGLVMYLADLVVTPDTGILHLAGIAGVPTVGIFFTIEPEKRIKYFPRAAGYVEEAWVHGPYWGDSKAIGKEQMAIMEQVNKRDMSPDYLAMWDAFRPEGVLEMCEKVLATEPVKPKITGYLKRPNPRVAVFCYDPMSNYFDDRLPLMLMPQVLPADSQVDWIPWRPYKHVPLCRYDLVVLGANGGLTRAILEQPGLIELIRAAKTSIGVFGVEMREKVPHNRLQAILGALSHWFARSKSDLEFAGYPENASHLGWWGTSLWPIQDWFFDDTLQLEDKPRMPHAIDHAMYELPMNRRCVATHIEPMVCSMSGADEIKYIEKLTGEFREPKMRACGFEHAIDDILGVKIKPEKWFKISRAKVCAYKKLVRANMDAMRKKIQELLA